MKSIINSENNNLKILQLTQLLSTKGGGVQTAVLGLTNCLFENGIDVELWGEKEKREDYFWENYKCKTRTFESLPFPGMNLSPGLIPAIYLNNYSLLHLHGIWSFSSFSASFWNNKKPKVISPQGMLDPWIINRSGWKKKIGIFLWENRNFKNCSCFQAVSQSEYESIRSLGLKQPIALIPNGVNLPVLTKTKIGQRGKIKTILYIGRFHPKKNILSMINGWNSIKNHLRKNWRLRICGWGDINYERDMKRIIKFPDVVEGPLFGESKESAFREASAFILPSLSEGLPLAVLEAMSYKLPVLMSGECNLPEGFSVRAALETGTKPEDIAKTFLNFISLNRSQKNNIGSHGRKLIEKKYNWPIVASEMLLVYQWLLGLGKKPKCVITN